MDTIDKIFYLIKEKNINQVQFSKESGITNSLLTQWKQRIQKPSLKSLKKISDYFKIPLNYFTENNDKNQLDDFTVQIKLLSDKLSEEEKTLIIDLIKFYTERKEN